MKPDFKTKIESVINNQDFSIVETLTKLRQIIEEADEYTIPLNESIEILDLTKKGIQKILNPSINTDLIRTEFKDFDDEYGGFNLGELIVIGGRPGMGKTQFIVNLAMNMSPSTPTLVLSLDLAEHLIAQRFISFKTSISFSDLSSHNIDEVQKEALINATNSFKDNKLFINTCSTNSIFDIRTIIERHIKENDVKIIFVDYLQGVTTPFLKRNREQEVAFIIKELKRIAKEHNVCVIITSQLSRNVESRGGDKRPQLSDLRESGNIDESADKVIFLYRANYYGLTEDEYGNGTKGVLEVILAKNSNGKTGYIKLQEAENFTGFLPYKLHENIFIHRGIMNIPINEEDLPF
jgi:replicative DNA helicase